jgi:predicted small secreted protein
MRTLKPLTKSLLLLVAATWLTGCATAPGISTNVSYCCRPLTDQVYTFRIEFEDTPEFLKPMLRDEAAMVLNAKGLQYTEGDADAVLNMTFVNKTLERDQERIEAWEKTAPAGGVRFIAQVVLEMTHSVTGEQIWSGSMQRVHTVYEGSYMHDAPARTAMRNAFLDMFEDYPDRRLERE